MEDVLSVYTRPYDPRCPQVCLDETSVQLLAETRPRAPMSSGYPERYDYEYQRHGVGNLFMCYEPLAGRRQVTVRERRTKVEWAWCIKELLETHYPGAEKVVLVMDNLNTHTPASLYEAFPPEEARKLAQQLELHYTPKMAVGSIWRRSTERSQQAVFGLATWQTLHREVAAWQETRNAQSRAIDWHFTTADARIKLKHLYPSNHE